MRSLGELYGECKEMGVISSQKAFSLLWGKQPSWFSSTQSRRRIPTTEALVTFYIRLEKVATATRMELEDTADEEEAEALADGLQEIECIRAELWSEIILRSQRDVPLSLR